MEPFIIMSDYVHVTKIENGSRFHQQLIAKIEHNLIAFCYINMILFCPFLRFAISGLKRKYFN